MLRPSERWYWTYCFEKDRLLLEISDEAQYCSPFSGKQLMYLPKAQALSMAQAEAYWSISDSLQQLNIDAEQHLQWCLAALSAAFVQQQAHKSWYFQQGNKCDAMPYELVQLRGLTAQTAIVLSAEADCVTCLLLGEMNTLAGKTLPQLQVIRVLRNRISQLNLAEPHRRRA